jgi:hypothetical protein
MFAKVAYALAVRDYGWARLKPEDVYILNSILGKRDDVGSWVGGLNQTQAVYGDDFNDQVVGLGGERRNPRCNKIICFPKYCSRISRNCR